MQFDRYMLFVKRCEAGGFDRNYNFPCENRRGVVYCSWSIFFVARSDSDLVVRVDDAVKD